MRWPASFQMGRSLGLWIPDLKYGGSTPLLTTAIGVPLAAKNAVLLFDVSSAQDDVLASLSIRLAHPVTEKEDF